MERREEHCALAAEHGRTVVLGEYLDRRAGLLDYGCANEDSRERAATSICRMSTAKSFPRALSAAPFLCLIECHLE